MRYEMKPLFEERMRKLLPDKADFEKFEKIEFMKTLRQNFLDLKNKLDDNIKIIDASKTKEEVFEQIKKEI